MYTKVQHALLLTGGLVFVSTVSRAQRLDLPRPSQQAKVMQRIGITEITINYSRPLVKGRKIWGGLEPYGKVWRAGANENTTIEFSDPVRVEGKPLAKGTYGLHMIPEEKQWTVIFSKNHTSWGSYTYDPAEDALRVAVTPQTGELHEALTYDFVSPTPDSSTVVMQWEKVSVPFKVDVSVHELVQASIKDQLRGVAKWTWLGWDEAANYLLANKLNLDQALKYADESIGFEERFDNLMTKANVLEGLNRKNDAASNRKKALALGSAVQLHSYGRQLQTEGKQQEAFDVFRTNMKKNPNHWVAHNEAARLACAQGNYDGAVKEMKLAMAGAPTQYKPLIEPLVKRLEEKQDINKM
jgi:tetratricopeptide (TPR) repeat protein